MSDSFPSPLGELAVRFALVSLVAVGGANAVMPDIHRQFVVERAWLGEAEFANLVALSTAAPGPNVLLVALIGWKVAGLAGALVSTAAMCGPSSLLAMLFARAWWSQRWAAACWRTTVQQALAPIPVGFILASGWVITLAADGPSVPAWALTAGTTVLLSFREKFHPLWLIALGALLGALGWI